MQYCEVCGVLIANAPSGAGATICERCFASRKVIVAPDEASSNPELAPARVQFGCPSCESLLQLPPVAKRTKIKCPSCKKDFYMHPGGEIEAAGGTAAGTGAPPPRAIPPTGRAPSAQEKLLDGLGPTKNLDDLLERVPQRKAEALPSVLDTGRYKPLSPDSGSDQKTAPGTESAGFDLLPDSNEQKPLDLLPDSDERRALTPPKAAPPPKTPTKKLEKIPTARKTREQVEAERKKAEERAARTAQAAQYTNALEERRRKRTVAVVGLVSVVLGPLVVLGVCLASTTGGAGFAVGGKLGAFLASSGEVARRGVEGLSTLVQGK